MEKKIYALGVGHNTPVAIDLAEACGYKVVGLYHYNDERTGEIDHGIEILGSFSDLLGKGDLSNMNFLLTMGDNQIRTDISNKILALGGNVPTLIHPNAIISKFARISDIGVYVSPFTYVQADSEVGSNSVLLSHVNISHNTKIGNSCFIAGGSIIGAYTNVEDFVFVGQGVLTISAKVSNIGSCSYIGARSLITKDVPQKAVMMGSPAKILKFL